MKILSAEQIRQLDSETIKNEPITSIQLMERAARACVNRLVKLLPAQAGIIVVCGKGNNGGDGLAIGRLLLQAGYSCQVAVINYTEKFSNDALQNFQRLAEEFPGKLKECTTIEELKQIVKPGEICIDCLLGTGINKPAQGLLAETIEFINEHFESIISIDVPSGLFIDQDTAQSSPIIKANLCLTFQSPKLAFLLPQNKAYVQEFELLDIGLDAKATETLFTNYHYITRTTVTALLKPRQKFSHKGTYGNALLMAGSMGKSGAALIAAKACLRCGAGRLTVHSNRVTLQGLLTYLPEAMGIMDSHPDYISEVEKPEQYDAIAFGPGVGMAADTQQTLKKLLQYYAGKLVIDADGLNTLSENKTWLNFLPANCILTPHPKEFERLCGKQDNDFETLQSLRQFSMKYNCIVILKGAHSAIAMPDGSVFFNSSGNAGLAKAGSGDGLTGILLGLLSRGYNAPQSAIIGTFLHGYAADLCLKKQSMESLLISEVIEKLPKAFKLLEQKSPLKF